MEKNDVKNSVKISVVIPVYNAEPYLHSTIQSVMKQSFQDFEIVCVNDGSTDGSLRILEQYKSKDPRITVYNKPNTGIPSITKNYGIDRSTGEYVFVLDADDYLSDDILQNMYDRAKETNADCVAPDLIFFSEKGDCIRSLIGLNGNRRVLLTNRQAVFYSINWTIHGNALWRGTLIRRVRFEEFGTYSDEYSTRILLFNSNKVVFCQGSYFYRQYSQSISKRFQFDRIYNLQRLSVFLKQNSFDERTMGAVAVSSFKDIISYCNLLASIGKELPSARRKIAETKIKNSYCTIDRKMVRKYIFYEPGFKKYLWLVLTIPNWALLKSILLLPAPEKIKAGLSSLIR